MVAPLMIRRGAVVYTLRNVRGSIWQVELVISGSKFQTFVIELSLDCRFPSKACSQSIDEIFAQVSRNHGVSEKILKLQDHVNRLRDEMKTIDAFKRELPLCMRCGGRISSAQKSNAEPVLEEFIPLKKSAKYEQIDRVEVDSTKKDISYRDKMNWMSSMKLWNSDSDLNNKLTLKLDNNKKRAAAQEVKQPAKDNVFHSIKNRTVVPLKGWRLREAKVLMER
ncbi:hypothetical protein PHJA_001450500 [Phtheirospermum japonicum]|uniref:HHO5-like N-terminal domain-containing protein n=1 Tax=Phtheirospermum japonicum TaxID=374723 RepID=A0A830C4I7_9LAMI|nr:hypothetical protein PHJA_001450500 [Phtheirospermum japonicum]